MVGFYLEYWCSQSDSFFLILPATQRERIYHQPSANARRVLLLGETPHRVQSSSYLQTQKKEELQRGCPQTQKNWAMRVRDVEKDEGSWSEQKRHTMNVISTPTHEFWPQEFFVTLQVSLGGCFFNVLVCFSTSFFVVLRFAFGNWRCHSNTIRTTNFERNAQSRAVHCESQ